MSQKQQNFDKVVGFYRADNRAYELLTSLRHVCEKQDRLKDDSKPYEHLDSIIMDQAVHAAHYYQNNFDSSITPNELIYLTYELN